jgi:hypothetical protein
MSPPNLTLANLVRDHPVNWCSFRSVRDYTDRANAQPTEHAQALSPKRGQYGNLNTTDELGLQAFVN